MLRFGIPKSPAYVTAVATKPDAGRTSKITERQKRLIKLEQVRDDTLSLTDFVRFACTDLNLDKLSAESFGILMWFRKLHLENLELLLHKDVLELPGVMNI